MRIFMGGVVWIWVRIGYMDGHGDWVIVLNWSEIVVEDGANKKELLVKYAKNFGNTGDMVDILENILKQASQKFRNLQEYYQSLFRRKNKFLNHLDNDIAHIVINIIKKFIFNTFDPQNRVHLHIQSIFFHFHKTQKPDKKNMLPITQENPSKQPQNLSSSRHKSTVSGLREYITTSNQCQYVRKRLKILERVQDHNQAKVKCYKGSLEKYQLAKIQKQQEEELRRQFMRKKNCIDNEQKEINKRNRDERRNKIYEVLKEIQEERIQDRNRVRQQSQNIAQKIQQNKQKDLLQKRQKRNRVIQLQNESKQNYKNFFIQKKDYLTKKTQAELSQLQTLKAQKTNQIKKMNKIELTILDKQNNTKNQYSTVRVKLGEIYGVDQYKNTKNCYSMHSPSNYNHSTCSNLKSSSSRNQGFLERIQMGNVRNSGMQDNGGK